MVLLLLGWLVQAPRLHNFFQLSTKFTLLINVKMPTIVDILTFISMVNTTSERLKANTSSCVGILVFMNSGNFVFS